MPTTHLQGQALQTLHHKSNGAMEPTERNLPMTPQEIADKLTPPLRLALLDFARGKRGLSKESLETFERLGLLEIDEYGSTIYTDHTNKVIAIIERERRG